MPKNLLAESDTRPLLDALTAVREALDIPHAATVGDDETRAKILDQRLSLTVIMLRGILERPTTGAIPWSVGYLREQLAKHPAQGYKTWAEAVAEMDVTR